jgi:hypothetical protein
MLDLTKIPWPAIHAVRQNMGLEPTDTSSDSFIASLPPREFIGRYSAWHLGTPAWGHGFYDLAHSLDAARIDADATSQARQ